MISIDKCNPNPCNGHGECSVDKDGYVKCDCHLGFTGERCSKE